MIETDWLNGLAGAAALVNSLLLWPIVRGLKDLAKRHDARISRLESSTRTKPRRRAR